MDHNHFRSNRPELTLVGSKVAKRSGDFLESAFASRTEALKFR